MKLSCFSTLSLCSTAIHSWPARSSGVRTAWCASGCVSGKASSMGSLSTCAQSRSWSFGSGGSHSRAMSRLRWRKPSICSAECSLYRATCTCGRVARRLRKPYGNTPAYMAFLIADAQALSSSRSWRLTNASRRFPWRMQARASARKVGPSRVSSSPRHPRRNLAGTRTCCGGTAARQPVLHIIVRCRCRQSTVTLHQLDQPRKCSRIMTYKTA